MPIGAVTKFNVMEKTLMEDASRQWDDATAGSNMFILVDNTYVIDVTDLTAADLTGIIIAGDGVPINLATPTIDETTTPGTTFIDSDDANFGAAVTITAKFLVCVQPVVAGTYAATAKLLWVVDLDTTSSSTSQSSTASDFVIVAPTDGWVSFT